MRIGSRHVHRLVQNREPADPTHHINRFERARKYLGLPARAPLEHRIFKTQE